MGDEHHDTAVSRDLRELIDSWIDIPAFVRDKHLTVLAANPLARAVCRAFDEGVNLVRSTFIDSDVLETHPQADTIADHVTGTLRESLERHESDSGFEELVVAASGTSGFAGRWSQDGPDREGTGTFVFPGTAVGSLRLTYQQLTIPRRFDQTLVVWHAADESSRVGLVRLAELATGEAEA